MTDSLIFIGKFDENMRSLENKIVNLSKNTFSNDIPDYDFPDVIKMPIVDYNCDAWIFSGDVKPTLLLKDLISKTKIILFLFNTENLDTLQFLEDGWKRIIEKVDLIKRKDQIRFLVGTHSKSYKKTKEPTTQIQDLMNNFSCSEYFKGDQFIIEKLRSCLKKKEISISSNKTDNKQTNNNIIERENDEKKETIEGPNGFIYNLSIKNLDAEIFDAKKAKRDVLIPVYANISNKKYKIIGICNKAFEKSLINSFKYMNTEVNFTTDTFTISPNAFDECSLLKNITIKTKSTITLSKYSFYKIPNLESVEIVGNKVIIDNNCFNYCFNCMNKNVKKIKIESNSSVEIGSNCFNFINSLNCIEIIGKEIIIKDNCFKKSSSLSKFVISRASDIRFGEKQFEECNKLTDIKLSSTSKINLPPYFLTEKACIEIIDISSKEIAINNNCFKSYTKIKKLTFRSAELITLHDSCITENNNLESISFSTSALTIHDNCFQNCFKISDRFKFFPLFGFSPFNFFFSNPHNFFAFFRISITK